MSAPSCLPDAVALAARPVATVPLRIGFIEFVSVLAMRLSALPRSISQPAKGQTFKIPYQPRLKHFFYRQARMETGTDRGRIDADFHGPFRNGKALAVEGQATITARVVLLNRLAYPAAIFRFVVSIVIDAVQRAFQRTRPHVGKEVCEILPPVANLDAASAIMGKGVIVRVLASLAHLHPRSVFMEFASAVTTLMKSPGKSSFRGKFVAQATTRSNSPNLEMGSANYCHVSAFAFANPVIPGSVRPTNNSNETTGNQTGNILWQHEQFSFMGAPTVWHITETGDYLGI